MTSRRRRVTGRLLFRIGLVCLVQLLLFIMGMDLVRRSALEEPWRRGLERTMAYTVSEWAPLRGQPEALQAALDDVDVAPRVDHDGLLRRRVDEQRAVAPERACLKSLDQHEALYHGAARRHIDHPARTTRQEHAWQRR